jgi:hypothetical protein
VKHLSGASKRMFVEQKVQDEIRELQKQLKERTLYLESLPKYDDGLNISNFVQQHLCGASVPGTRCFLYCMKIFIVILYLFFKEIPLLVPILTTTKFLKVCEIGVCKLKLKLAVVAKQQERWR